MGAREVLLGVRNKKLVLCGFLFALLVSYQMTGIAGAVTPQVTETQKIAASDAQVGDTFGAETALDGNTLIVGADGDSINGVTTGSAYVFTRSDTNSPWVQEAKLIGTGVTASGYFGTNVAISGDTAVVGAFNNNFGIGSVHVFVRSGATWTEQAVLQQSDTPAPNNGDQFGLSVAISANTIFVGSSRRAAGFKGAVYVFERTGSTWTETDILESSDGEFADQFGASVAVSGNNLIVGAYQDDDNGESSGSAYIYKYNGSSWVEADKVIASDGVTQDRFGYNVAISGSNAIVSAHEKNNATGAAYVYNESNGDWSQAAKLVASDAATLDNFGYVVAINGNKALVGARNDNPTGPGSFQGKGSAYVFERTTSWNETAKYVASDASASDGFGGAVSLSANTAIVSAPYNSTGTVYSFAQQETVLSACDGLAPTIIGTENNDYLIGTDGNDIIVGLGGDDRLEGKGGSDIICGGNGNDTILGGQGQDEVYGDAGDDILKGDNNPDKIIDLVGNNTVYGGSGVDEITTGAGNDTVYGGFGDDVVLAGDGNDTLYGDAGNDNLNGDAGTNNIDGGSDTDTCINGINVNCEI